MVKNLPAKAGDEKNTDRFDPWVGKIPWRRAWQPTPVFLRGESDEQKRLVGYSPQGHKQWGTMKPLSIATREESGVLGVPSRRGLTPRGSLECNPEIPAFPGEEN